MGRGGRALDPEEFYDFQVNRPTIGSDRRRVRRITWPSTQVYVARPPDLERDVVLVRGIEPNMQWRQFSRSCWLPATSWAASWS